MKNLSGKVAVVLGASAEGGTGWGIAEGPAAQGAKVVVAAEAMSGPGSVVLISSMSATHPIFPHFAYACGKAATECLVKYAALEYGPRQIRVNGIRIATVFSDMAKDHYSAPGVGERFIHEIPLGRLGQPADMADTVVWLSGPAYITGSMLDISGGNQLNRFPFIEELPGQGTSYEGSGAKFDREHSRGTRFKGI